MGLRKAGSGLEKDRQSCLWTEGAQVSRERLLFLTHRAFPPMGKGNWGPERVSASTRQLHGEGGARRRAA